MAIEIDTHEKGAEISYLVVVLHFVYGDVVQHKVGDQKQRRGETALDSEVYRTVVRMLFDKRFFGFDVRHIGRLSLQYGGEAQKA